MAIRIANSQFIHAIRTEVFEGCGFVPMVGSGLSADSGILMGQQFSEYLAFCVKCAISDKPHNLDRDGWPGYPNVRDAGDTKEWVKLEYSDLCKRLGFDVTFDEEDLVNGFRETNGHGTRAWISDLERLLSRPPIPRLLRGGYSPEQAPDRFHESVPLHRRSADPLASLSSRSTVKESAIRSLADWRYTLQFLSEIRLSTTNPDSSSVSHIRPRLGLPDPSLIDRFNLHITRDRKPNLGHTMLAHLARPLRVRTVLTTNFDELIETAFKEVSNPLAVFAVSARGGLPHPVTVRSQNSIVKLHGQLIETRADFSLDDEPTDRDKAFFLRYFWDTRLTDSFARSKRWAPQHLFVIGYSATDRRCVKLLKYLLDECQDIRLFWICFSESDAARLNQSFSETEYMNRILCTQCDRPDLLLYELYQHLTYSLPGGGLAFDYSHHVPPVRARRLFNESKNAVSADGRFVQDGCSKYEIAYEHVEGEVNRDGAALDLARAAQASEVSAALARRVLDRQCDKVAVGIQEGSASMKGIRIIDRERESEGYLLKCDFSSGAAEALTGGFSLLSQRFKCVWLELQDYSDPLEMLHSCLRSLSLSAGRFQLDHLTLVPPSAYEEELNELALVEHLRALSRELGWVPSECVIFLYGRNGPGACAGWFGTLWGKLEYERLTVVMRSLVGAGFRVVYAPLSSSRIAREKTKCSLLEGLLDRAYEIAGIDSSAVATDFVSKHEMRSIASAFRNAMTSVAGDAPFPFDPRHSDPDQLFDSELIANYSYPAYERTLQSVLSEWLAPPHDVARNDRARITFYQRLQFLYALTLFRQSRHASAFFSGGVLDCPSRFNASWDDNDYIRAAYVIQWTDRLKHLGVLYSKPGGYSWMYRDVRLGLQYLLERLQLFLFPKASPKTNFFREMRSRIHIGIAEWYLSAHASTGHATPAIEALFHSLEALRYCTVAKPSSLKYSNSTDMIKCLEYRCELAQVAIALMEKTAQQASESFRFWLPAEMGILRDESIGRLSDEIGSHAHGKIRNQGILGSLNKSREAQIKKARSTRAKERITQLLDKLENLFTQKEYLMDRLVDLGEMLASDSASSSADYFIRDDQPRHRAGADRRGRIDKWNIADDANWRSSIESMLTGKELGGGAFVKALHEYENGCKRACTLGLDKRRAGIRESARATDKSIKESRYQAILTKQKIKYLPDYLHILAQYAYLHVRRAKLEYHGNDEQPNPTRWAQATIICNEALTLARHLPAPLSLEELLLRCKVSGLYGLSLGHLGRFVEAHRHLNEADALLSRNPVPGKSVEQAIVFLRRAELHLAEAAACGRLHYSLDCIETSDTILKQLRRDDLQNVTSNPVAPTNYYGGACQTKTGEQPIPVHPNIRATVAMLKTDGDQFRMLQRLKTATQRQHAGYVDDAVVALESAERLLAGASHSSLWWGRLVTLKLRLFREVNDAYETLLTRKHPGIAREIDHLLRRGLLLTSRNAYRRIRIYDYALNAIDAWSFDPNCETARDLRAIHEDLCRHWRTDRDNQDIDARETTGCKGLVAAYYERVNSKLTISEG